MHHFSAKLIGFWLIATPWLGQATAQECLIRSWHIEDGLPDATITAIAQTPDGYLWIGTPKGLARFDGALFKVWDSRRTSALGDGRISSLLVDHGGTLWVGCESGMLLRMGHGGFEPVKASLSGGAMPATTFVHDTRQNPATRWMWGGPAEMAEDAAGGIWSIRLGGGLLRTGGGQTALLTPTNGLPAGQLGGLCRDGQGRVWLAAGERLSFWSGDRWVQLTNSPVGPLPRLAVARQGGIWVAAPNGTWTRSGGSVRRLLDGHKREEMEPTPWVPDSLRSQVTSLLEDRTGRLWLGMLWNGIYHARPGQPWQRVQTEGPLVQCVITCFYEDRQGAVWVGTVGEGLHRVTQRPVTMLKLPPPAQENIITASCAARDRSVWVGTDGAGAFRYADERWLPFGHQQGLTESHVCSILEDGQTNLWCGTWNGLFHFENGRFVRAAGPPELRLSVLAMFEDRSGRLWVGTSRGLACRQRGEWSLQRLLDQDALEDIRSLAEDATGALWVGTIGQGLFRLQEGRLTHFGADQGFESVNVRSLHCDEQGVLWIGTAGAGLRRLKDGRFTGYTVADGLPCDTILTILPDGAGNLWMSSDSGVFACSLTALNAYEKGRSPALLCVRLTLAEGLGSRACSGSGQPVASRLADGRFCFPNMRGLALFDPRAVISAQPEHPSVLIESVVADGVALPSAQGQVTPIDSSTRRFEFHYTAPDLVTPQALRFRHKLEGMDEDWVEAENRRVAYYSQLPPGQYQFRVMAGSADGQWHEGAAPLVLRVIPRPWELRWVQVLAAMVLAAAGAGLILFNARRKLRRRLEWLDMERALEAERRRIARDLHDDIGSRLTEIVLTGELTSDNDQESGEIKTQLKAVLGMNRQLVAALDEAVWTINPKNDSLPALVEFLCDYAQRFVSHAQLECRLDLAGPLPPVLLSAAVRHNLLLAVKEAITNAVRHAAAATICLRIRSEGPQLLITVTDDGRGFEAAEVAQGEGLQNMRHRLDALGGSTRVRSRRGEGTAVTFSLPLPVAKSRAASGPGE